MTRFIRLLLFGFAFCLALMPEDFGIRSKALPDISLIRLLLALLTLSFILGLLAERGMVVGLKAIGREFGLPVLLLATFFGWNILTSIIAPAGAGTVLTAIRDMVYFFIPFIAALVCLRGQRDVKRIALMVGVSASLSALIGTIEYVSGLRLYALITAADSAWHVFDLEKGGEFVGVLSTFPHPLAFGSFMAAALLLGLLLYTGERGLKRAMAIVIILLCFIGIFASTSRGAQASLVAAIAFALLIHMQRLYRRVRAIQRPVALLFIVLPMLLVTGAGVAIVGYGLVGGGSEDQLSSSMMRLVQLEMSVAPISLRPILGYGAGEAAVTLGMKAVTVDNYYLTVILESGLVGLLLFIATLTSFLIRSTKAYIFYRQPVFLVMAMFFAAEGTQLLVLSLKQALPLLYVGFAALLVMEREFIVQNRAKNSTFLGNTL